MSMGHHVPGAAAAGRDQSWAAPSKWGLARSRVELATAGSSQLRPTTGRNPLGATAAGSQRRRECSSSGACRKKYGGLLETRLRSKGVCVPPRDCSLQVTHAGAGTPPRDCSLWATMLEWGHP